MHLFAETANTIGAVFFNVVQVICFRERSPCSVWQRSELDPINYSFTNDCSHVFQTSEIYVPPNDKFFASVANKRFLIGAPRARSIDITDSNEVAGDDSVRLGVKVASIGLVARNLLKEAFRVPIEGLIGFFQRTFNSQKYWSILCPILQYIIAFRFTYAKCHFCWFNF